MQLLYDLDVILYRALFAAERKTYTLETGQGCIFFQNKKSLNNYIKENKLETEQYTIWTEHQVEPWPIARSNITNTLNSIRRELKAREEQFFLSDKDNFRFRYATVRGYKANRAIVAKPVHLPAARAWAETNLGAIIKPGLEADDLVGIAATELGPDGCWIITNDKDLRQIPGWHYNWTTRSKYFVSPKEAGLYFFQQLLCGDLTDNVPGVEGLGEVGSLKLLDGCSGVREAETRVLQVYIQRYGEVEGKRRFLETGRLVHICKASAEPWKPKYINVEDTEGSQNEKRPEGEVRP